MDFAGRTCAPRAIKKQCVKQNSIDRNGVPRLLRKKRQEECAPYYRLRCIPARKLFIHYL
jgi:hypothetical protein